MKETDSEAGGPTQVQVVRLLHHRVHLGFAGPGNIDVWLGDITQDPVELEQLNSCLTPAERDRANAIRHPSARAQALTGRARLRELLGRHLHCLPQMVDIETRPDGKPVLCGPHAGIRFNLSHTHDHWAAVIATVDVGIDLELIRPMPGAVGLVQRYFHPSEAKQFHAIPEELRIEAFFRGWTQKEAVLKGLGCGIRGLERIVVDLDPRRTPRILGDRELVSGWQVASVKPTPHTMLSVAVRTGTPLQFTA